MSCQGHVVTDTADGLVNAGWVGSLHFGSNAASFAADVVTTQIQRYSACYKNVCLCMLRRIGGFISSLECVRDAVLQIRMYFKIAISGRRPPYRVADGAALPVTPISFDSSEAMRAAISTFALTRPTFASTLFPPVSSRMRVST